jgi:hypothetical protein
LYADTASSLRGDASHNRDAPPFKTLKKGQDSVICPIKLLLIVALRLGNVRGKTIDEALCSAAERRDKTIQWLHTDRPVLCAFGNVGSSVQSDKPAGNHQLTQTCAQAAPLAGFLEKIRAHDLLRGAARDAANIIRSVKGHATPAVAVLIGHSEKSHLQGVTASYVGGLAEDVWTKRVEENFEDMFCMDTTDDSFVNVKRRKLGPSEITDICEKQGLDPAKAKNRAKASLMQKQKTLKDWSTAAQDADGIGDMASLPAISSPPLNFLDVSYTNLLKSTFGKDLKSDQHNSCQWGW